MSSVNNRTELHSWGNYPSVRNNVFIFDEYFKLDYILKKYNCIIPYGNGRSYGDSALSKNIIYVKPHNFILGFDENTGLLHTQAGVLFSEILDIFVPRGWFLRITPGTKLITIGGAIASDVHGKNHHFEGCFSECIETVRLMLPDGKVVNCSKQENPELFRATCGGMGLTGVILDARIWLKRINSANIDQTTVKTGCLRETFEVFEKFKNKAYSVAWVDCLAKGEASGRSLVMVGDFAEDGELAYRPKKNLNIPFFFPTFALNTLTVKIFNMLYYGKVRKRVTRQTVDIDTFFYPLDAIDNWNRIYGKDGFIQYHFVLPKKESYKGLQAILKAISDSGKGSFLAVLKLCGKANENYLSFPLEGYSLALDFKLERGLFEFLDQLDALVLNHGGRIYLTKDARVSREVFEQGYPKINEFRELRRTYEMNTKINSLQSIRLKI